MDFEEYWRRFNEVEARHGLLKLKIDGFSIYALRRVKFYYEVAIALGLFNNPHPGPSGTQESTDSVSLDFSKVNQTPTIVVPFRREVAGAEPYSATVVEKLRARGEEPNVFDWAWAARIQTKARIQHRKQLQAPWRPSTFRAKWDAQFEDKNVVAKWAEIIGYFEAEFGVQLPKLVLPESWFARFKIEVLTFARYFKSAKVRDLYIVDAYSNQQLVIAAHRAGVRVSEIQHGFVSEFHPAYSFPLGSPKLEHTPDRLLVWGSFWIQGVQLPSGMSAEISGPTQQFSEYRAQVESVARNDKQILFTSQGAISEELQKAAVATAKAMPDYEVVYRLHPNEHLESYPQKGLPTNFSYSHRTPVFLEMLASCGYLVGAFSTTLYEGLALGAKVLVLPLQGHENMQRAIDSGDVTLIEDINRIPDFIRSAKRATNPDVYYTKESTK
jgi:hypothetical protein